VADVELAEMKKTSVKLGQDLMRKVKMVATSRGQTVIDYLEALLAPQVQADLEEAMRRMTGTPVSPKRKPKGGDA